MALDAAVQLLTTALLLLQLVTSNPSLPQSLRDTAQSVAQNAITQATQAISGQSTSVSTPTPNYSSFSGVRLDIRPENATDTFVATVNLAGWNDYTWEIDWGEGDPSTQTKYSRFTTVCNSPWTCSAPPGVMHTYRTKGDFYVTLNAVKNGVRTTVTQGSVRVSTLGTLPNNAPTISYFNSSAVGVSAGQPVTFSWASNAANCHLWQNESNGGYGAIATNAGSATSYVVYPTASKTYTLNCFNLPDGSGKDGASTQRTAYVSVNQNTTPSCSITANKTYPGIHEQYTISWTTHNMNNPVIDDRAGAKYPMSVAPSGSTSISSNTSRTYYIGEGESGARYNPLCSVTVNVALATPSVSISASPSSIIAGQASTLSWSSSNANRCYLSNQSQWDAWTDQVSTSGSRSVSPSQTTSYRLFCSNDPGTGKDGPSADRTVTVPVTNPTHVFNGNGVTVHSGPNAVAYMAAVNTTPGNAFTISGTASVNGPLTVVLVAVKYAGSTDWSSVSQLTKDGSGYLAVSNSAAISGGNWSTSFGGLPEGYYHLLIYDASYNLKGSGFLVSTWKG